MTSAKFRAEYQKAANHGCEIVTFNVWDDESFEVLFRRRDGSQFLLTRDGEQQEMTDNALAAWTLKNMPRIEARLKFLWGQLPVAG